MTKNFIILMASGRSGSNTFMSAIGSCPTSKKCLNKPLLTVEMQILPDQSKIEQIEQFFKDDSVDLLYRKDAIIHFTYSSLEK